MRDEAELAEIFLTQLILQGFDYVMYNRDRPDAGARQVLEGFDSFVTNMKPQKLRKGIYYRARVIDTQNVTDDKGFSISDTGKISSGFNELESGKAPECIIKSGRLNHEWEAIWYLASDAYTAMAEVHPPIRGQVSLAKYEIVDDSDVYVLNFASKKFKMKNGFEKTGTALENWNLNKMYVQMQSILTLPAYKERTYYISNIVGDMIKKTGVSGVRYKSFYGKGTNIALWDIDEKVLKYCGSKVFLNYCSNNEFISLEDEKKICKTKISSKQKGKEPNKAIIESQKMYTSLIEKHKKAKQGV